MIYQKCKAMGKVRRLDTADVAAMYQYIYICICIYAELIS